MVQHEINAIDTIIFRRQNLAIRYIWPHCNISHNGNSLVAVVELTVAILHHMVSQKLVNIKTGNGFGSNPLPEPMLTNCYLEPSERNALKIAQNYTNLSYPYPKLLWVL